MDCLQKQSSRKGALWSVLKRLLRRFFALLEVESQFGVELVIAKPFPKLAIVEERDKSAALMLEVELEGWGDKVLSVKRGD